MFSFFTDTATVKRQVYLNNKSSYIDTGLIYKGYYKPVTLNDLINKERIGKEFKFTTFITSDIREGDILNINGEDYNVKAIVKKRALRNIKYLQCLLVND